VGAGLLIGGIVTSGHRLVRDDAPVAHIEVVPVRLGRGGYGVAMSTLF
jgi:hypothetical protein